MIESISLDLPSQELIASFCYCASYISTVHRNLHVSGHMELSNYLPRPPLWLILQVVPTL